MSSHHIIREDQEPALLILDADALSLEKVNELLEWSPTVLVCEEAIEKVLGWGIKIDIAILSDSNSFKEELSNQQPIQFLYITNRDFITESFNFILKKKYKSVNVLIHEKNTLNFLQQVNTSIEIVTFYKNIRWSLIRNTIFEKWLTANTQIYLYPNLDYNTHGFTNEMKASKSGLVSIECATNYWVGEDV